MDEAAAARMIGNRGGDSSRGRLFRTIGPSFAVFYAEISAYIGMYNRVTGDVRVAALNKAANNATDMSHPEARCRLPMPKSVITSSPR